MNPAQKALWFIESHLADALTLDEIAAIAGVSRFHLVRAFAAATGLPVMRYVRARRLSEAARALANGAPDILALALEADYGSHEAFTRAFRDHFGVTPEAVRGSTRLDHLRLQEPITMDSTRIDNLQAPRFETGKPLLVAGLGERYTCETGAAHSRPVAALSPIGGRTFPAGSGRWPTASAATATTPAISTTSPASKCPDFSDLPREFSRVRIPEQKYAVFTHRDHISTIRRTINTIWNHWLPASGLKAADAPNFERYDENFDPLTGNGGSRSGYRCGSEARSREPRGAALRGPPRGLLGKR